MKPPQVYFARVNENQVTHVVKCDPDWTVLNPWPNIAGTWVQVDVTVQCGWLYDPDTGVFTPPA